MFDAVLSFGDSWPAGEELQPNEITYAEIIAKNLGIKFVNYSEPGTSLEHMIFQVKSAIQTNKYHNPLAIFFLTDFSRSLFFNTNGKLTDPWNPHKEYYSYVYNDHLGEFKANQTLLCLQAMCQSANFCDYYIMGWTKFSINLPGINIDKIFHQGQVSCLNLFKVHDNDPTDNPDFIFYDYNHYIRPNSCHPNQLGHQVIADSLLTWIDQHPN